MRTKYHLPLHEEHYYHVYNRAVTKARLFYRSRNYHYFMDRWVRHIDPFCDLLAYCLIPNHFHFVIRVKRVDDQILDIIHSMSSKASKAYLNGDIAYFVFLESQFQRYFLGHALHIKKQEKRNGALFQKGFKRVLIKSERQLVRTISYVHHNPIHHQLAPEYDTWKYSSYQSYLKASSSLVSTNRFFELLSFDPDVAPRKQFIAHHEEYRIGFNPKWRVKDQVVFE
ncbi:MAG: hypothetical protein AAGH79_06730 [Bacteroidota bacterium]